jgi:hypothetical protein
VDVGAWAAFSSLVVAILSSILAPYVERRLNRREQRQLASRAIRDDFYAYQTLLGAVPKGGWWTDGECDSSLLLASDSHYRVLAGHVSGAVWKDVSGARRRWQRMQFARAKGADPSAEAEEIHDLNKVLDKARQGLAAKDKGMPFQGHWSLSDTEAYSEQHVLTSQDGEGG